VAGSIRRALVVGDGTPGAIGARLVELGLVVDAVAAPAGVPSAAALRVDGIRPRWDWTDDAGRTVSDADLVRLVGHVRAWRIVVDGGEPVLVVDGDAIARPGLADVLAELDGPGGPDAWDVVAVASADPTSPWADDVPSAAALVVTPGAATALLGVAAVAACPVEHLVAAADLDVLVVDPGVVVAPPARARVPSTAHLVVATGSLAAAAAAVAAEPGAAVLAWVPPPCAVVADPAALLAAWAAAGGDVVVATTPDGTVGRACIGPVDRLVELGILTGDVTAAAARPTSTGTDCGGDAAAVLEAAVRRGAALDHDAVVFHPLGAGHHGLVAVGGRVRAVATGIEPPVLVAAGAGAAARLAALEAATADGGDRDLVRLFAYTDAVDDDPGWEVVAPEIVRVPFWTPAFCSTVVRTAFAADAWDQDPDDPVPGREVSLAALSPRLFAHVEEHVGHCVVPVLRAVWPELGWFGLQDAFVIAYAPGPDAGLRLHHDVAQVSAAVRLADDHEGGALEFPRQGWDNRDVPVGHLVAWPSLVTHPHRAAPVTAGCKVGLTLWFRLPEG
jgi:hypothetical protein